MAGRKPLPTAVKAARGTLRASRQKVDEPKAALASADVAPPRGMRKEAVAEWRRLAPVLVELCVLTTADLAALRAVCEAWCDYVSAQRVATKAGAYYKTTSRDGSTMIRAHPAIADRSDAWRRYRSGLVEFGLTPASRSRVSTVDAGGEGKSAAGPRRLEDWMRER